MIGKPMFPGGPRRLARGLEASRKKPCGPWVEYDPEIFEPVHAGILVIDEHFRIESTNRAARDLLEADQAPLGPDETCHYRFHQLKEPCPDCPVGSAGESPFAQKALRFKRPSGEDCYLKEYISSVGGKTVVTLQDVTREIWALRKTEFARKELQAKNVLVERHRRENAAEKTKLNHLLNHLPDALVLVDDQFRILHKNTTALESLPAGHAGTCYGLFGRAEPCDSCPAKNGFSGIRDTKNNHSAKGECYTEIIAAPPGDGGGLLVFRNTTQQIRLIEKIRDQQETITHNNEILSRLVRLGTLMQKETDPKVVVDLFLDLFIPVCHAEAAAVLISDMRPGSLWFTAQRGFEDDQMARLVRAVFSTRVLDFDRISHIRSRFVEEGITTIEINGADGQPVGLTFVVNMAEKSSDNLIPLFFEPLGAYIHNRILTRQLEDRANRDHLTGLYNRGYLEKALEQEEKKHAQSNLPYAVVVADVNGLKPVNDIYGHEAGDAMIRTAARHLSSVTRETDCLARTGGDEFVILMSHTTDACAQQAVKRLAEDFCGSVSFEVSGGERIPVSVSFGACGVDKTAPAEMLQEADRRMYRDKENYYKEHPRYR